MSRPRSPSPPPPWPPAGRRRRLGRTALLAAGLCLGAHARAASEAPVRGWLRYADGNALSGVLVARTAGGGVVRTDRFGEVSFQDAEARFEAQPASGPAPQPAAPAPAVPAGGLGWRPAKWSIGVSGSWEERRDSITSDLALDVGATWRSQRDEIRLALAAHYKVANDTVDTNEQRGSLRWVHELGGPWVSLASMRLQRSTFAQDPLPKFDYVLAQATAGLGWRRRWSPETHTLIALNVDRVAVDLLQQDRRDYTRAVSVLLENQLRLGAKVRLDNTLLVYHWPDGSTGVDSTAELGYDLTENLRVGLRHETRRQAVNLDVGRYNRVSLTTRVAF